MNRQAAADAVAEDVDEALPTLPTYGEQWHHARGTFKSCAVAKARLAVQSDRKAMLRDLANGNRILTVLRLSPTKVLANLLESVNASVLGRQRSSSWRGRDHHGVQGADLPTKWQGLPCTSTLASLADQIDTALRSKHRL